MVNPLCSRRLLSQRHFRAIWKSKVKSSLVGKSWATTQVLSDAILHQSTKRYFEDRVNWEDFDYSAFYRLLGRSASQRPHFLTQLRQLSGGEKIKFLLLCEMIKRPTLLLLDEPSNDLDLESVQWLEGFIRDAKVPVMFVSHDELLLQRCANTIIHLEQLMRKRKPQYTIARLSYGEYVKNRDERIVRQTRLARKEREEYEAKMERYRRIHEKVQHGLRSVSAGTIHSEESQG